MKRCYIYVYYYCIYFTYIQVVGERLRVSSWITCLCALPGIFLLQELSRVAHCPHILHGAFHAIQRHPAERECVCVCEKERQKERERRERESWLKILGYFHLTRASELVKTTRKSSATVAVFISSFSELQILQNSPQNTTPISQGLLHVQRVRACAMGGSCDAGLLIIRNCFNVILKRTRFHILCSNALDYLHGAILGLEKAGSKPSSTVRVVYNG